MLFRSALASGIIFSGLYLGMHDSLGADKTTSFIFSASITLAVGFIYKVAEQMSQSTPVNFGKPMLYNTAGIIIPAIPLIKLDL